MKTRRRVDPYRNFKFRLSWKGRIVAGFSESSVLDSGPAVRRRQGSEAASKQKWSGLNKFLSVTLKRGVTHDDDFAKWLNSASAGDHRRGDVSLTIVNERGQPIAVHRIRRAWPSEFQGLRDLDANANAVAIQHLKLEHEGCKRDEDEP